MPVCRKSLRYALWDVFFFSLMVGAGESYLPAYALSVGMSEWLTGLFATVPLMSGALIQMISPWALYHVGSVKKWVVGTGYLQALTFVPLFYFSLFPTNHFLWLFLIAAIYWGASFASAPMWNYWMNQLVPKDEAENFFALRHKIGQVGVLIGLVGGGLALHLKLQVGPFTSVFSTLFLIAFVCRLSSSYFLSLKREWKSTPDHRPDVSEIFALWKKPSYRRFFGFLFLFNVMVYISAPFVTPYFLEKLHLDYNGYMLSIASLLVAKILVMPFAGKLMKKYGVKRVFYWGALGIAPIPALWPLSQDLYFVMTLQAISGAFWGLFEVALTVTFFNQIKPKQKILILTVYNFFNAGAVILGSLAAGQVLKFFNASFFSYAVIFVSGAVLRCLVAGVYFYKVRNSENLLDEEVDPIQAQPESFPVPAKTG
ncbi:MAG: MFS transporter [Pseudobdellovibrionaceae bacterium]